MDKTNLAALIIVFTAGTLLIIASAVNWKVLFENRPDNFITRRYGKNAYRWIYAFIGTLMWAIGIYALFTNKLY